MPIEIACNSCNKRLRVPDTAAGKRVRCPQCKTVLSVPAAGGSSPSSAGKVARYHLKTEDGQTFGPVPKAELDEWFAEERITADCQILREGAEQWQWATDIYPQLASGENVATPQAASTASRSSTGGFPQIDTGGGNSAGNADDNPFAFAAADSSPTSRIAGGRRTASSAPHISTAAPAGKTAPPGDLGDKSKMVAGLLGCFLGAWGVHRFYLGYTGIGIVQVLVTIFTCGLGGLWGFIEGIMIFTGSIDRDASGRLLKE